MANKGESSPRVSTEKIPSETDEGIMESEERKWGIPLIEMYKQGLAFYKGKALHLSYEDRLKLVAYTQQAAYGALDLTSAPPLGVLDVIGRDRRAAWQALGQTSQVQAMAGFLHTLERLCPLFKPYVEAIQKDFEAKKQQQEKIQKEEKANTDLHNIIIEETQKQQSTQLTEEQQVQKINDALKNMFDSGDTSDLEHKNTSLASETEHSEIRPEDESTDTKADEEVDEHDVFPPVEDANMWTRGDITVFKESACVRGLGGLGLPYTLGSLTVGHRETVTIRVPTHAIANCLHWEFATDNYDIGFGLYFEWEKTSSSEVTVHVSDSDNEDDAEDDDGFGHKEREKECLDSKYTVTEDDLLQHRRPLLVCIVPLRRRDCHTEMSHEWLLDLRALTLLNALLVSTPECDLLAWRWTAVLKECLKFCEMKDDRLSSRLPHGGKYAVYQSTHTGGLDPDPGMGPERRALQLQRPPLPVSIVVPIFRRDCHTEVYAGSHTCPGKGVYFLKFDNTYSFWRSKTLYFKVNTKLMFSVRNGGFT